MSKTVIIPNRPPATVDGFKKVKIPKPLYKKILSWYLQNEKKSVIEWSRDPSVKNYIRNETRSSLTTEFLNIKDNEKLTNELNETMHQELSEWSKFDNLIWTSTYGIRTYNRGDILASHCDIPKTHIISAILSIYQEDMDEPWGLQIRDHDGWWNEVFLEPGEMVFYESDILEHGRMYPLRGEKYANLFIHFMPEGYIPQFDVQPINQSCNIPQVDLKNVNFIGSHNATELKFDGKSKITQIKRVNEPCSIELFKNVLSKKECSDLIKGYDKWEQARTHSGNLDHDKEIRKATNAVYEDESPLLRKVREVIAEKTNTNINQQEWPISIIRYDEEGEYKEHLDAYDTNYQAPHPQMGNRWKTAILYLNSDYEGGETYFPKWNKTIKGKPGELLVWDNLNKDKSVNTDTLHAGLPVTKGVKYIVVSWIREFEYSDYKEYIKI